MKHWKGWPDNKSNSNKEIILRSIAHDMWTMPVTSESLILATPNVRCKACSSLVMWRHGYQGRHYRPVKGRGGHKGLRCCGFAQFFFFLCSKLVKKIPHCGVAMFSNPAVCYVCVLNLQCSVKRNYFSAVLWHQQCRHSFTRGQERMTWTTRYGRYIWLRDVCCAENCRGIDTDCLGNVCQGMFSWSFANVSCGDPAFFINLFGRCCGIQSHPPPPPPSMPPSRYCCNPFDN